MPRTRVRLITLGGTIAMASDATGALRPSLGAEELARLCPDGLSETAEIELVNVRNAPSSELSFSDVAHVARLAEEALSNGATGVVVSQGTDVLEETAFALELLLPSSAAVVVTGAMRSVSQLGSDAARNLSDAIRLAAAAAREGERGVVVLMNGEIHAPRFVQKAHMADLNAFTSAPLGPIGWVQEGRVVRLMETPPLPRSIWRGPPPAVAMLDVGFDFDTELLGALLSLRVAGVVVAGLGAGHVPSRAVPDLERLARTRPVVLASRTGQGGPVTRTYGYPGAERDLLSRGLISAGWLHPRKARVLLSLLLGEGADRARIAETFGSFYGAADQRHPD